MQGLTEIQRVWRRRQAVADERGAKEASRREEYDRLWAEPRRRADEALSRHAPSESEKKAAQAQRNAEAPARREAHVEHARFLNQLADQLAEADRQVTRLTARARSGVLTGEEVELFLAAQDRARGLRVLVDSTQPRRQPSPFVTRV